MTILATMLRRVALLALTLLLVSLLTFAIVNVLPGDVATAVLGDSATPTQVAALRRALGLDLPLAQRYLAWLGQVLRGDLGVSLDSGQPIAPMLLRRLGNSAILALLALALAVPVSIVLGVVAAVWRGGVADRCISGFVVLTFSLPEYVIGLALVLVFSMWLDLLPGSSLIDPSVNPLSEPKALVLPVAVIALHLQAYFSQLTRASMIEALASGYVRAAVLKGVPRWRVVIKHALRNALLPTISDVGMTFGTVIGGLVIVETLFSYAGIGQLLSLSVDRRDVPTIQVCVLVVAASYGVGNLVADIVSLLVNPRLRG
jgi:peptide/nickel transport system permease protein